MKHLKSDVRWGERSRTVKLSAPVSPPWLMSSSRGAGTGPKMKDTVPVNSELVSVRQADGQSAMTVPLSQRCWGDDMNSCT